MWEQVFRLLREVLEYVSTTNMDVNIELKTGIYWYPQIEEKTAFIVQETECMTE